jgi:hypothetical protein
MTPAKVEEWLISQEGTGRTFFSHHCYKCLFAVYLSEQTGIRVRVDGFIGGYYAASSFGSEKISLPGWADSAIKEFDGSVDGRVKERGLKSCLRIIRGITQAVPGE